jgi:hypothetical protein
MPTRLLISDILAEPASYHGGLPALRSEQERRRLRQHGNDAIERTRRLLWIRAGIGVCEKRKGDPTIRRGGEKGFAEDTIVQFNYLPTLRAKQALIHSNPQQAIDTLEIAAPYELGLPAGGFYNWPNMYPVYVRGEAYLAANQGAKAAAEFQKILDHRGIVPNEPIGALAHLQLGRAYAMSSDMAKARAAYSDFLTLWKDADPDIPILKEAKAEYAKLQ